MLGRGALDRMAQGGGAVDGRVDLATGRLDRRFHALDLAVADFVGLRFRRQRRSGTIAFIDRHRRCRPAVVQFERRRFAARLQHVDLLRHGAGTGAQRIGLAGVEGDLLLETVDGQFRGVGNLARGRRLRLRFREFDARTAEVRLDLRHPGACGRLTLTRIGQACARRLDRFRQLTILAREEHLLPAPQFVAQLLVALGLASLALQRAALLLHFEDDVVDAGEVLLRGIELQFRRAAAGFVLRDTGRFLDELTAVGRTRAEDEADLPLLDDGVGLRTEAGVHQQVVDVAQAARMTVDEVLALAGPIQSAGHFHFASDRLDQLLGLFWRERDAIGRSLRLVHRWLEHGDAAVGIRAGVHLGEGARVGMCGRRNAAYAGGRVEHRAGDRLHDATETETHLGRRARLARVTAVEDDVLHLLAAQALGALLAHDPRDRVGDVALAASIGTDNGRHALVEGKLRPVREGLEPVDLEFFQTHEQTPPRRRTAHVQGNGGDGYRTGRTGSRARPHPSSGAGAHGPQNGAQCNKC